MSTGMVLPADLMTSIKAIEEPGLWNQLTKIGHYFHLLRYFMPFLYYCRHAACAPRIFNFLKELKKDEAKNLPVGVAGFCWVSPSGYIHFPSTYSEFDITISIHREGPT